MRKIDTEDNIIKAPLTSEEPLALKALANSEDYFTDKVSKMFGIPYEQVTEEQRAEAKKRIFDYVYGRSDNNPFSSEVN